MNKMSAENATEPPLPLTTTVAPISTLLVPLTPLITTNLCPEEGNSLDSKDNTIKTPKKLSTSKDIRDTSRNSDSGKSSSCSPTLLDCSFDSGIAGVLLDANDMQRHKRIQLCQRILLALERDREHFCAIRNRLSKITERKKKKIVDAEFVCNVCCAEIDPENAKTFVKCFICQKYICRSIKCADWLAKTAQWECELCQTSKESLAQTSSWVADQLSFNQQKLVYPMRARSEIFIPISECNDSSIHFESVSQVGANAAVITAEQRLKIREYVEEIVSHLLGGNLDTISVNQLSKSETYLPAPKTNGHHPYTNGSIVSRHDNGIIGGAVLNHSRESTPGPDFTDLSEARLRNMIQKIIAETVNMAPLTKSYAVSEIALDRPSKLTENMGFTTNGLRHRTEHYFEPTIYQDLLATAVLNKIVDKQSNNNNNRNMSESSPDLSRRSEAEAEVESGVAEDGSTCLDQNYNIENHSITSGSSVEPRSDCSYTDTEPIVTTSNDKSSEFVMDAGRDSALSDYIAAHMVPLPNLSTMATESEEDDYMSVTSSAVGDSTWENNWLFKKKKSTVSGSLGGSSVGMLVPDPKEDVRAQIGDKTADEISDLSELGSDTDDSSVDLLRSNVDPINDRLFNKHLIGGQNSKLVLDELIERSSMISNTLPTDQEQLYTETRNENVEAPNRTEAINSSVTQQQTTNNNEEDQKNLEAIMPPIGFDDSSSNPLTAVDEIESDSEGCVGYGQVEDLEPTIRTPSVIEILAAIALGPMIAIPAADEPAPLTTHELTALNDLRDLALLEIKNRSIDLISHSLGVIHEEIGEMDLTNFPTSEEMEEELEFPDSVKVVANIQDTMNVSQEEVIELKNVESVIPSEPEKEKSILQAETSETVVDQKNFVIESETEIPETSITNENEPESVPAPVGKDVAETYVDLTNVVLTPSEPVPAKNLVTPEESVVSETNVIEVQEKVALVVEGAVTTDPSVPDLTEQVNAVEPAEEDTIKTNIVIPDVAPISDKASHESNVEKVADASKKAGESEENVTVVEGDAVTVDNSVPPQPEKDSSTISNQETPIVIPDSEATVSSTNLESTVALEQTVQSAPKQTKSQEDQNETDTTVLPLDENYPEQAVPTTGAEPSVSNENDKADTTSSVYTVVKASDETTTVKANAAETQPTSELANTKTPQETELCPAEKVMSATNTQVPEEVATSDLAAQAMEPTANETHIEVNVINGEVENCVKQDSETAVDKSIGLEQESVPTAAKIITDETSKPIEEICEPNQTVETFETVETLETKSETVSTIETTSETAITALIPSTESTSEIISATNLSPEISSETVSTIETVSEKGSVALPSPETTLEILSLTEVSPENPSETVSTVETISETVTASLASCETTPEKLTTTDLSTEKQSETVLTNDPAAETTFETVTASLPESIVCEISKDADKDHTEQEAKIEVSPEKPPETVSTVETISETVTASLASCETTPEKLTTTDLSTEKQTEPATETTFKTVTAPLPESIVCEISKDAAKNHTEQKPQIEEIKSDATELSTTLSPTIPIESLKPEPSIIIATSETTVEPNSKEEDNEIDTALSTAVIEPPENNSETEGIIKAEILEETINESHTEKPETLPELPIPINDPQIVLPNTVQSQEKPAETSTISETIDAALTSVVTTDVSLVLPQPIVDDLTIDFVPIPASPENFSEIVSAISTITSSGMQELQGPTTIEPYLELKSTDNLLNSEDIAETSQMHVEVVPTETILESTQQIDKTSEQIAKIVSDSGSSNELTTEPEKITTVGELSPDTKVSTNDENDPIQNIKKSSDDCPIQAADVNIDLLPPSLAERFEDSLNGTEEIIETLPPPTLETIEDSILPAAENCETILSSMDVKKEILPPLEETALDPSLKCSETFPLHTENENIETILPPPKEISKDSVLTTTNDSCGTISTSPVEIEDKTENDLNVTELKPASENTPLEEQIVPPSLGDLSINDEAKVLPPPTTTCKIESSVNSPIQAAEDSTQLIPAPPADTVNKVITAVVEANIDTTQPDLDGPQETPTEIMASNTIEATSSTTVEGLVDSVDIKQISPLQSVEDTVAEPIPAPEFELSAYESLPLKTSEDLPLLATKLVTETMPEPPEGLPITAELSAVNKLETIVGNNVEIQKSVESSNESVLVQGTPEEDSDKIQADVILKVTNSSDIIESSSAVESDLSAGSLPTETLFVPKGSSFTQATALKTSISSQDIPLSEISSKTEMGSSEGSLPSEETEELASAPLELSVESANETSQAEETVSTIAPLEELSKSTELSEKKLEAASSENIGSEDSVPPSVIIKDISVNDTATPAQQEPLPSDKSEKDADINAPVGEHFVTDIDSGCEPAKEKVNVIVPENPAAVIAASADKTTEMPQDFVTTQQNVVIPVKKVNLEVGEIQAVTTETIEHFSTDPNATGAPASLPAYESANTILKDTKTINASAEVDEFESESNFCTPPQIFSSMSENLHTVSVLQDLDIKLESAADIVSAVMADSEVSHILVVRLQYDSVPEQTPDLEVSPVAEPSKELTEESKNTELEKAPIMETPPVDTESAKFEDPALSSAVVEILDNTSEVSAGIDLGDDTESSKVEKKSSDVVEILDITTEVTSEIVQPLDISTEPIKTENVIVSEIEIKIKSKDLTTMEPRPKSGENALKMEIVDFSSVPETETTMDPVNSKNIPISTESCAMSQRDLSNTNVVADELSNNAEISSADIEESSKVSHTAPLKGPTEDINASLTNVNITTADSSLDATSEAITHVEPTQTTVQVPMEEGPAYNTETTTEMVTDNAESTTELITAANISSQAESSKLTAEPIAPAAMEEPISCQTNVTIGIQNSPIVLEANTEADSITSNTEVNKLNNDILAATHVCHDTTSIAPILPSEDLSAPAIVNDSVPICAEHPDAAVIQTELSGGTDETSTSTITNTEAPESVGEANSTLSSINGASIIVLEETVDATINVDDATSVPESISSAADSSISDEPSASAVIESVTVLEEVLAAEKIHKKVHFVECKASSSSGRAVATLMNPSTSELASILSAKTVRETLPVESITQTLPTDKSNVIDIVSDDIIPPPPQFSFDESDKLADENLAQNEFNEGPDTHVDLYPTTTETNNNKLDEPMMNSVESAADICVVCEIVPTINATCSGSVAPASVTEISLDPSSINFETAKITTELTTPLAELIEAPINDETTVVLEITENSPEVNTETPVLESSTTATMESDTEPQPGYTISTATTIPTVNVSTEIGLKSIEVTPDLCVIIAAENLNLQNTASIESSTPSAQSLVAENSTDTTIIDSAANVNTVSATHSQIEELKSSTQLQSSETILEEEQTNISKEIIVSATQPESSEVVSSVSKVSEELLLNKEEQTKAVLEPKIEPHSTEIILEKEQKDSSEYASTAQATTSTLAEIQTVATITESLTNEITVVPADVKSSSAEVSEELPSTKADQSVPVPVAEDTSAIFEPQSSETMVKKEQTNLAEENSAGQAIAVILAENPAQAIITESPINEITLSATHAENAEVTSSAPEVSENRKEDQSVPVSVAEITSETKEPQSSEIILEKEQTVLADLTDGPATAQAASFAVADNSAEAKIIESPTHIIIAKESEATEVKSSAPEVAEKLPSIKVDQSATAPVSEDASGGLEPQSPGTIVEKRQIDSAEEQPQEISSSTLVISEKATITESNPADTEKSPATKLEASETVDVSGNTTDAPEIIKEIEQSALQATGDTTETNIKESTTYVVTVADTKTSQLQLTEEITTAKVDLSGSVRISKDITATIEPLSSEITVENKQTALTEEEVIASSPRADISDESIKVKVTIASDTQPETAEIHPSITELHGEKPCETVPESIDSNGAIESLSCENIAEKENKDIAEQAAIATTEILTNIILEPGAQPESAEPKPHNPLTEELASAKVETSGSISVPVDTADTIELLPSNSIAAKEQTDLAEEPAAAQETISNVAHDTTVAEIRPIEVDVKPENVDIKLSTLEVNQDSLVAEVNISETVPVSEDTTGREEELSSEKFVEQKTDAIKVNPDTPETFSALSDNSADLTITENPVNLPTVSAIQIEVSTSDITKPGESGPVCQDPSSSIDTLSSEITVEIKQIHLPEKSGANMNDSAAESSEPVETATSLELVSHVVATDLTTTTIANKVANATESLQSDETVQAQQQEISVQTAELKSISADPACTVNSVDDISTESPTNVTTDLETQSERGLNDAVTISEDFAATIQALPSEITVKVKETELPKELPAAQETSLNIQDDTAEDRITESPNKVITELDIQTPTVHTSSPELDLVTAVNSSEISTLEEDPAATIEQIPTEIIVKPDLSAAPETPSNLAAHITMKSTETQSQPTPSSELDSAPAVTSVPLATIEPLSSQIKEKKEETDISATYELETQSEALNVKTMTPESSPDNTGSSETQITIVESETKLTISAIIAESQTADETSSIIADTTRTDDQNTESATVLEDEIKKSTTGELLVSKNPTVVINPLSSDSEETPSITAHNSMKCTIANVPTTGITISETQPEIGEITTCSSDLADGSETSKTITAAESLEITAKTTDLAVEPQIIVNESVADAPEASDASAEPSEVLTPIPPLIDSAILPDITCEDSSENPIKSDVSETSPQVSRDTDASSMGVPTNQTPDIESSKIENDASELKAAETPTTDSIPNADSTKIEDTIKNACEINIETVFETKSNVSQITKSKSSQKAVVDNITDLEPKQKSDNELCTEPLTISEPLSSESMATPEQSILPSTKEPETKPSDTASFSDSKTVNSHSVLEQETETLKADLEPKQKSDNELCTEPLTISEPLSSESMATPEQSILPSTKEPETKPSDTASFSDSETVNSHSGLEQETETVKADNHASVIETAITQDSAETMAVMSDQQTLTEPDLTSPELPMVEPATTNSNTPTEASAEFSENRITIETLVDTTAATTPASVLQDSLETSAMEDATSENKIKPDNEAQAVMANVAIENKVENENTHTELSAKTAPETLETSASEATIQTTPAESCETLPISQIVAVIEEVTAQSIQSSSIASELTEITTNTPVDINNEVSAIHTACTSAENSPIATVAAVEVTVASNSETLLDAAKTSESTCSIKEPTNAAAESLSLTSIEYKYIPDNQATTVAYANTNVEAPPSVLTTIISEISPPVADQPSEVNNITVTDTNKVSEPVIAVEQQQEPTTNNSEQPPVTVHISISTTDNQVSKSDIPYEPPTVISEDIPLTVELASATDSHYISTLDPVSAEEIPDNNENHPTVAPIHLDTEESIPSAVEILPGSISLAEELAAAMKENSTEISETKLDTRPTNTPTITTIPEELIEVHPADQTPEILPKNISAAGELDSNPIPMSTSEDTLEPAAAIEPPTEIIPTDSFIEPVATEVPNKTELSKTCPTGTESTSILNESEMSKELINGTIPKNSITESTSLSNKTEISNEPTNVTVSTENLPPAPVPNTTEEVIVTSAIQQTDINLQTDTPTTVETITMLAECSIPVPDLNISSTESTSLSKEPATDTDPVNETVPTETATPAPVPNTSVESTATSATQQSDIEPSTETLITVATILTPCTDSTPAPIPIVSSTEFTSSLNEPDMSIQTINETVPTETSTSVPILNTSEEATATPVETTTQGESSKPISVTDSIILSNDPEVSTETVNEPTSTPSPVPNTSEEATATSALQQIETKPSTETHLAIETINTPAESSIPVPDLNVSSTESTVLEPSQEPKLFTETVNETGSSETSRPVPILNSSEETTATTAPLQADITHSSGNVITVEAIMLGEISTPVSVANVSNDPEASTETIIEVPNNSKEATATSDLQQTDNTPPTQTPTTIETINTLAESSTPIPDLNVSSTESTSLLKNPETSTDPVIETVPTESAKPDPVPNTVEEAIATSTTQKSESEPSTETIVATITALGNDSTPAPVPNVPSTESTSLSNEHEIFTETVNETVPAETSTLIPVLSSSDEVAQTPASQQTDIKNITETVMTVGTAETATTLDESSTRIPDTNVSCDESNSLSNEPVNETFPTETSTPLPVTNTSEKATANPTSQKDDIKPTTEFNITVEKNQTLGDSSTAIPGPSVSSTESTSLTNETEISPETVNETVPTETSTPATGANLSREVIDSSAPKQTDIKPQTEIYINVAPSTTPAVNVTTSPSIEPEISKEPVTETVPTETLSPSLVSNISQEVTESIPQADISNTIVPITTLNVIPIPVSDANVSSTETTLPSNESEISNEPVINVEYSTTVPVSNTPDEVATTSAPQNSSAESTLPSNESEISKEPVINVEYSTTVPVSNTPDEVATTSAPQNSSAESTLPSNQSELSKEPVINVEYSTPDKVATTFAPQKPNNKPSRETVTMLDENEEIRTEILAPASVPKTSEEVTATPESQQTDMKPSTEIPITIENITTLGDSSTPVLQPNYPSTESTSLTNEPVVYTEPVKVAILTETATPCPVPNIAEEVTEPSAQQQTDIEQQTEIPITVVPITTLAENDTSIPVPNVSNSESTSPTNETEISKEPVNDTIPTETSTLVLVPNVSQEVSDSKPPTEIPITVADITTPVAVSNTSNSETTSSIIEAEILKEPVNETVPSEMSTPVLVPNVLQEVSESKPPTQIPITVDDISTPVAVSNVSNSESISPTIESEIPKEIVNETVSTEISTPVPDLSISDDVAATPTPKQTDIKPPADVPINVAPIAMLAENSSPIPVPNESNSESTSPTTAPENFKEPEHVTIPTETSIPVLVPNVSQKVSESISPTEIPSTEDEISTLVPVSNVSNSESTSSTIEAEILKEPVNETIPTETSTPVLVRNVLQEVSESKHPTQIPITVDDISTPVAVSNVSNSESISPIIETEISKEIVNETVFTETSTLVPVLSTSDDVAATPTPKQTDIEPPADVPINVAPIAMLAENSTPIPVPNESNSESTSPTTAPEQFKEPENDTIPPQTSTPVPVLSTPKEVAATPDSVDTVAQDAQSNLLKSEILLSQPSQDISTDLSVSVEDDSSLLLTSQATMVEMEDPNPIIDSASGIPDETTVQPLGNHSNFRKLQRQYGLEYTTPSFEDVGQQQSSSTSPSPTPPRRSTHSLAALCQKYIYDKHLLGALENRRRQTLLMHRFLNTIDSFHSGDGDSMEDTDAHTHEVQLQPISKKRALVVVPPASVSESCSSTACSSFSPPITPPPVDNEQSCHDHSSSDCEDCSSDSRSIMLTERYTISYDFINKILFSDQISSNSSSHNDRLSHVDTVEEDIENTDDEKDFIADKLKIKKCRKSTCTSISTYSTNNIAATCSNKPTRANRVKGYTSATSSRKRTNPNSITNPTTTNNNNNNKDVLLTKQSATCAAASNNIVKRVDNGYGAKRDISVLYDSYDDVSQNDEEENDELGIMRRFVPGSIAEREYKKWYNAVEMPNNPYAPEALKRRISGGQERFIDLPKISPSTEQCPLDMITKDKLTGDESNKRESEFRRYSRDYYINDCTKSSQNILLDQDTSTEATETSEQQPEPNPETSTTPASPHETQTEQSVTEQTESVLDLYTAVPAQVVEDTASSLDTMSQQSMQSANTTTSDDSDTIKIYNFKKQQTTVIKDTKEKPNDQNSGDKEEQPPAAATKERPTALSFNRAESVSAPPTVTTPTRGSTPEAFKFLQPKRRLLDPSQVLSLDEDEPQIPTGTTEKRVIEKEVVHALPSVKALAKAFLMTSTSLQHSSAKMSWKRKAKTLPEGLAEPPKPVQLLEPVPIAEDKSEEDATIASDLSSLETDSLSVPKQQVDNTKDQTLQSSSSSPATTPPTATAATLGSPVPVRQGVLKSNIAFFENLKNSK